MRASLVGKIRRLLFILGKPIINHNARDTILLLSDPRGGSTWLSNFIKKSTNSATLWEPLRPNVVEEFKDIGMVWHQHIDEYELKPEFKDACNAIFSGKTKSLSNLSQENVLQIICAERLLIKIVNGQSWLPWLTRNFKFKYPPIHFVRHPCAVVASQIKHGAWVHQHNSAVVDSLIKKGYAISDREAEIISDIKSMEGLLAMRWALNNRTPLSKPKAEQTWITMTYERLLKSPVDEIQRLETFWGDDFVFSPTEIYPTSKTTRKGSPIIEGNVDEQLVYWKNTLEPAQINEIIDVVFALGIKTYTDDPMPHL